MPRPLRLQGGSPYLSEPVAMDDSSGGVHHRLDPGLAPQKRCVFAQIALADFSFRLHEAGERPRLTCFHVFAAGSRRSSRPSPSYSTRSRWRWCWSPRRRDTGISARRQRGLGGRARVASRRGQGSWPRMWAGGCAQRSGMSLRAARALCIALHNLHFAPIGPIGPKRVRSWVRYVARAKCEKCIGTSLSIHHSSAFEVSNTEFHVAYGPY